MKDKSGRLTVVGTGMVLGGQISLIAKSEIMAADVVFCLVDGAAELWLKTLHADVRSLQPHYGVGKYRPDSYRGMIDEVVTAVRAGADVCLALYGHPGVFALVGHHAIREARAEGHAARMEPGISAEACLYADLGIDPGTWGCQSFEATHYLMNERRIDASALLLLWQIALAGETSLRRFDTEPERMAILVDKLMADGYPGDHEVILYEAAMMAIAAPRIDRLPLKALPQARLTPISTLVLPPAVKSRPDQAVREKLAALDRLEMA